MQCDERLDRVYFSRVSLWLDQSSLTHRMSWRTSFSSAASEWLYIHDWRHTYATARSIWWMGRFMSRSYHKYTHARKDSWPGDTNFKSRLDGGFQNALVKLARRDWTWYRLERKEGRECTFSHFSDVSLALCHWVWLASRDTNENENDDEEDQTDRDFLEVRFRNWHSNANKSSCMEPGLGVHEIGLLVKTCLIILSIWMKW